MRAKVQASGSKSNQRPSSIDALVPEVLVALAGQEARARLGRLAKKTASVRASDAPPRAITSQRRRARRPGWVHDAVVRVLVDHGGPMRATHVHAAVEVLLGEPVSDHSVSWALAAHVRGPVASFVRVARGLYALA
jgi:hypothetical protein